MKAVLYENLDQVKQALKSLGVCDGA